MRPQEPGELIAVTAAQPPVEWGHHVAFVTAGGQLLKHDPGQLVAPAVGRNMNHVLREQDSHRGPPLWTATTAEWSGAMQISDGIMLSVARMSFLATYPVGVATSAVR